jgi:aromatic ring-opening dioxygenase catalytic subunit (LigB family)
MPSWFIPHGGGPCFFMTWNPPGVWDRMGAFLKSAPLALPQRPRAIVVVSAHWLEAGFHVTSGRYPELIYDYSGFPPHTYALQYPAPGAPELAAQISGLLESAGLPTQLDAARGFDHGMFIPLMLMFPQADIPVVQLSLSHSLDPAAHLQAGQALQSLREQGVLIMGSGMSFHNMRGYRNPEFAPVSKAFDDWLTDAVQAAPGPRQQALLNWALAPAARLCHPPGAEEHLLPLMVAAGAAGDDLGLRVYTDLVMENQVSAFSFGQQKDEP